MNDKCSCGGSYAFKDYCGAWVCQECGNHKGLERCYCGWSLTGPDGKQELIEMGETIDRDI